MSYLGHPYLGGMSGFGGKDECVGTGNKLSFDDDRNSYLVASSDDLVELYIGGSLQAQLQNGTQAFNSNFLVYDNKNFQIGSGADVTLVWDTAVQTNDMFMLGLSGSMTQVICDKADLAFDFAFGNATHPTTAWVSANQATDEWIKVYNDGTDGIVETDATQDLFLKAGGVVKFGTHTGLAAETLSGYITIKDSGGTSRKIGVIS